MTTKIQPVIMCGGAGTRVWPESRETMPKQFIALIGERSTFQETIKRVSGPEFETPIVITNFDYRFLVRDQLRQIGVEATIVNEPTRRDSGPAVAVAAALAARQSSETVVAVFASDHVIVKQDEFLEVCREAAAAARKGFIVTLGVKPTEPATGYGYIRPGAALEGSLASRIEAFVEKPEREIAERYVEAGYLWNSGNFFFRADVMIGELKEYEPQMMAAAEAAIAQASMDLGFLALDQDAFGEAPKKSIDYAVMERTRRAAVVPADVGWSDVGSWDAVWKLSEHDADGVSIYGEGAAIGSQNVYVRSTGLLTAAVGVKDIIVVSTPDAVLVIGRDQGDKVKGLVEHLRGAGRREATEHKRMYRPWGFYQSVDQGERHQVKRIVVTPGQRLSLQKHFHRAEHWIVVRGTAEVTRGDEIKIVHENESIFLPMGVVHRLANPGKINLELIEVQTGSYFGEDDIVRLEDIYNRTEK
jgi:mannose-1-phosphate guanylyltransferase / mannose-6-phosphate isomerase